MYKHPDTAKPAVNPFELGTQKCCAILKTQALLNAISEGGYDAAFGGARREEERSRAKERVYSFRDRFGQWDPKNQAPGALEHLQRPPRQGRVHPRLPHPPTGRSWTSGSTSGPRRFPSCPSYFAEEREMIVREGQLIPLDGPIPLAAGEKPELVMSRFRTLGCYPCTGAVRSEADTVEKIVEEIMTARNSERITRVIDHDTDGSMELKKREGYF